MPRPVVLATLNAALADEWARQLPPGRIVLRLAAADFPAAPGDGLIAVVVLDAVAEPSLPGWLASWPTIFVGEPRSLPFEQARLNGRGRVHLSYHDSRERLGEFIPLVEEIAQRLAAEESLRARLALNPAPLPEKREAAAGHECDWFDPTLQLLRRLDTPDLLPLEIERVAERALGVGRVTVYLRQGNVFQAVGGERFPADESWVAMLERSPSVTDGSPRGDLIEPSAEAALRSRLALWGARLLVPVHDNGRLLAVLALGVRDDGRPYGPVECARAVSLARVVRQVLRSADVMSRLGTRAQRDELVGQYIPGTLILGRDEVPARHLPLKVREVIGRVRVSGGVERENPCAGQPWRITAGPVAETGGIWASWQDGAADVVEAVERERVTRRNLLRDLALTLSHEVGNALVSLSVFRQLGADRPLPAAMVDTLKRDVANLEALNANLALLNTLYEAAPTPFDVREMVESLGNSLGLRTELGQVSVVLAASRPLLEFALRSLLRSVGENRGELGLKELVLRLRVAGTGDALTVLLALRGPRMELEGILPEPEEGAPPTHGRLAVLLAKEILRVHQGAIHAGPGMEGTEIQISLRKL